MLRFTRTPQVAILSSFESRLLRLESAVIPVHTQTENLQRLQDHVDRALSCLDHVIGYYHVATDTEKTIREGSVGGASVAVDLWAASETEYYVY